MGFALSAYNDAKTARKLAFSVFKKRDNEGWGEFCKQLDVLVFACTKTLIEALKATAPHYPEPLEG